ncbi:hypothetical protein BDY21DRAFT_61447 [Lineolata rhizophorae]|uniref:Uncharacterized protein n=1 Tax=Lineolata rhizophorae TaxID=578093 RepID=A0A6A6NX28_9PEZI|nr:hypothetical protein BDY21DRAFT_61447 [Lineolata rhizophorae]
MNADRFSLAVLLAQSLSSTATIRYVPFQTDLAQQHDSHPSSNSSKSLHTWLGLQICCHGLGEMVESRPVLAAWSMRGSLLRLNRSCPLHYRRDPGHPT